MGCKVTTIPKAPNGQESLVFKQLQTNYGQKAAVYGHLGIYSQKFKTFLGVDWEQNPGLPILDENGEPKLIDKYAYNLSGDRMNVITREIVSKDSIEDTVSPVDEKSVDNILTRWLQVAGIGTEFVESIKDKEGKPVSAIAKADMLNGVVEILRGNTISSEEKAEETAHFLIEMMGDKSPLLNKMMGDIEKYEIYKTVYQEYSGVENANVDKIKREAISRVIARLLVNPAAQFETLSDTSKANTWWDRVKVWLKSKFAGVNTAQLQMDIAPFVKAADIIRSGSTEGLQTIQEVQEFASKNEARSYYYHLTANNVSEQQRINTAFEDLFTEKVAEGYRNKETGAYVKNRVSDLVKKHYRKIFHKDTVDKDDVGVKALKGTYIHKLAEIVMNRIIKGEDLDNKSILQTAYEQLSNDPEFKSQPANFFTLSPGQIDSLVSGVKHIHTQIQNNQKRINSLTGTQGKASIHTELLIYDKKNDMGGTIDVAVVYSDGTVGIYDYKSIHMYSSAGRVQWKLPFYKSEAYSIQLYEYKRILSEQYGINNFAESRIIPIRVALNTVPTAGLYSLEMQSEKTLKKEYLEPIPVADELTSDKNINKTLTKMFALRKSLNLKLGGERQNIVLEERLNKLDRAIKKIQLSMDINYIIDEINTIHEEFLDRESLPADHKETLTHSDLADYREYIEVFSELSYHARNSVKESNDEKVMQKLKEVNFSLGTIKGLIQDKILELTLRDENIDLETPGKEVGTLGRLFSKLSEVNNPAFKFVFRLASRNAEAIRKELNDYIDDIDVADKALSEWASRNGKSKQDVFDMIYNKDTGELMGKYDSTFYTELEEARAKSDYKWFVRRANVIISSTTATKVDFDPETRAKFEEKKKKQFEYWDKKNKGAHNKELLEKMKSDYEEKFDISKHRSALYSKHNWNIKIADRLENYSDTYKSYLEPGNKEVLEYYSMYVKYNKKFAALTGKKIDNRFVAEIRQDMIDRIAQNGVAHVGSLKKHLLNSLEIRQSDNMHGELDSSGKPINRVPLLYTDKLYQSLTDKEIRDIRSELLAEIPATDPEFNEKFEKRISSAEYKKGLAFKTRDLTSSLILFAEQALSYHYYSETEEAVRNVQEYIFNGGGRTERTDGKGDKIIDPVGNKILTTLGIPKSEQEMMEKFIARNWYGRQMSDKDMEFGSDDQYDENGALVKKGKKYSGLKAVRMAMSYLSLNSLGFKPVLAASNSIGIKSNIYMTGAEGLYYTNKDIHKAHKIFLSRDTKYAGAINYFELHSHDMTGQKARERSASKMTDLMTADTWFIGHRLGDNMADNNVLVAMMHHYGMDSSGKIATLKSLPEGTISLWDTAKFDDNGKFSIPGLSKEQELVFRTRMHSVISRIKGTTTDVDRSLFDTTLAGSLLMKFRSWIPPLVKNRINNLSYDEILGGFDAGRFNVAIQELNRKGFIPKLQAFTELAASSIGLYKMKPDMELAQRLFDKFIKENKQYEGKLTLEQFIEFRKARLAGMAMELRILLSVFALAMAAKAMIPDEDDDDSQIKKLVAMNTYRILNRGLLEISFFFSPSSISQIIKSPVPAFTIFSNIGKWADNTVDEWKDLINGENSPRDNTPFGYRTLKMIPGVSSAVDFFDIFDTYSENFNRY